MQNHVISLASAAERRAHIADTFGARGIPFQFFDALMPSEALEQAMAELVPGLSAHPYLSSVEKACFMSHVVLWKQALDEGVLTSPSGVADYCGRAFPLLESEHWGTAGYIISRKAMRFFLDRFAVLPSERLKAVDWMLFSSFLDKGGMTVCQLTPALCIQSETLPSQLKNGRQESYRNRRSPKVLLKRALGKIGREIERARERKRQKKLEKHLGRHVVPFE
ncbi:glycosyltransferase family 25 protein [Neisseria meningitidis]|uniref:glycosyltransferase family 25 protein n=1 Tax=Neisseria meningitidis TaxID=487 RepID=UPI000A3C677C|nr:glycosyltransferase family 25 protein [Neisseria meningitidis]OUC24331.1 lacto-N-neotetraose biosynthesis glycosyl transferase [Neisseria meningitidis]